LAGPALTDYPQTEIVVGKDGTLSAVGRVDEAVDEPVEIVDNRRVTSDSCDELIVVRLGR
jgi:hypothetical protein